MRLVVLLLAVSMLAGAAEVASVAPQNSPFELKLEGGGIVSLKPAGDRLHTEYVQPGARLGDVSLRYRQGGGEWRSAQTAALTNTAELTAQAGLVGYQAVYRLTNAASEALVLQIRLAPQGDALCWTVDLQNASGQPLEIGELALPLPMNSSFRQSKSGVLKHSFISGHGSFLFWMRSDSAGPYLTLTPTGDTHFEFWQARSGYRVFIHAAAAGAEVAEQGGRWRQPFTSLTLAPKGQRGDSHTYGFKFRWAENYDGVRNLLVQEGGIDVHVVPGMTVPSDLFARFALRTTQAVYSVEAEFPEATRIEALGTQGEYRLYQARFSKLGENRLRVNYGPQRHMFLEFFSTEPLETVIKKRAAFIARCQHRDPDKWYNGLISEWNMETQVLLGPDNYDRIKGWRIYEVTCDDPGLSKPAFLASKNAEFPVQSEVEALDYYLEHFVWGGLQRTTKETYPYAIYGIPDWKQNRDSADPGSKGKQHFWRVYDYPHVILIYHSLYRVAKNHPQIKTALSAREYLQRAYGTALAMFTIPLEVDHWSAYETGFYNEVVIESLLDDLQSAGMTTEATRLREHWERKVKTFVNGKLDLFRSEYAFDSTGFESTHALAKYALQHADEVGAGVSSGGPSQGIATNRFGVSRENAQRFMELQMAGNLFCRGWLEPAYYYLGSDYRGGGGNGYTLTYMSQMGGWGVLDYALHFATNPAPYLRLGYASYLSAWALVNSGKPESNYGYWYPGAANDGAAGGGFEPAAYGTTWLGQPHHRGSWYYACEIDLGYCGALRSAATVLADDPIFGRFCFGGDWRKAGERLEVIPKDGLRRRFHAVLKSGRIDLLSEAERFAADRPLVLSEDVSEVSFTLESDNPGKHLARLHLSGVAPGGYAVVQNGRVLTTISVNEGQEVVLELPSEAGASRSGFTLSRNKAGPTNRSLPSLRTSN